MTTQKPGNSVETTASPTLPPVVIVVPCFNEEDSLRSFVVDLAAAVGSLPNVMILLIDDGSTDSTKGVMRDLAKEIDSVEMIAFTRNFGKEAAMLAGLEFAVQRSAGVIFIDADGQHPASVAAKLVESHRNGAEHVVAQRDRSDESGRRRTVARVAYRVLSASTQVAFVNGQGDFRLLSASLARTLAEMPERVRFSKGLYAWLGAPDLVLTFETPQISSPRQSSWGFRSLLDYAIDGITGFNSKPLRAVFAVGLAAAALSMIYAAFALIQTVRGGVDVPGYLTTITAVLFLGSMQLISLGVIGEYVGRTLAEVKRRPPYLVRESTAPFAPYSAHLDS